MELEVLPTTIRQETIMRGIQIGRKEVGHSWYSGDVVVLWRQHPNDATHQVLTLVNKFIIATGYNIDTRKFIIATGYNIDTRKPFPLLHANNEIS